MLSYERGDYVTALRELWPLEEKGDAAAQFSLGFMYINGHGVPKNDAEAVKWYRLAAEQGNALAQLILGAMYEDGHGVPKDRVLAYALYNLSAVADGSDNNQARRNRERIVESMSQAEIHQAQSLATGLAKPGQFSKVIARRTR